VREYVIDAKRAFNVPLKLYPHVPSTRVPSAMMFCPQRLFWNSRIISIDRLKLPKIRKFAVNSHDNEVFSLCDYMFVSFTWIYY